jgi:hypothetical protein
MYIQEYEFISIKALNIKKCLYLEKILNKDIELGLEYNVHWSLLKKSSLRRHKIKVICDGCNEIVLKRLQDLNVDVNEHFCRSCGKKGDKNPIFGLKGELNPKYGIKVPSIVGENNPAKRLEVREKISKSNKGKPSNMLGKNHSKETIDKIKKSNTGQKRNETTIEKIREARKKQVGENCPGWKGGITSHIRRLRNSDEYQLWRKSIFNRDQYKCKLCSESGVLNAHHIIGVSVDISLIFDTNNGITLCKKCHFDFHSRYGMKEFPSILEIYKIEIK